KVLTKTARLWSPNVFIAAIPLAVWVLGFFGFLVIGSTTGDQWLGSNIRTVALLFAGIIGGIWPFVGPKSRLVAASKAAIASAAAASNVASLISISGVADTCPSTSLTWMKT